MHTGRSDHRGEHGRAVGQRARGMCRRERADTIHLRALNAPKDATGIRDLYRLTSVYVHTVVDGPNGLPPITSVITLKGGGAEISRTGGPAFRVLHVMPGGRLVLNNLAVTGGLLPNATPNSWDRIGAGVLNLGVLEVNNGYVAMNSANCDGGGLGSYGPLTVRASTFRLNTSGCSGGAIQTYYAGQLTIADSTFEGNAAPAGSGGALMVHGTTTAVITNTTIENNTAQFDGGGLLAHGGDANVAMTNTRIRGNRVTGGHGGGIANGRLNGTVALVAGGLRSIIR